jgi:hypothetical protein
VYYYRSRAETAGVHKAILWEFPFGVQYAWMLLIFAMTTVYSLSCPLITPFGKLATLAFVFCREVGRSCDVNNLEGLNISALHSILLRYTEYCLRLSGFFE